jgi:superfamily II DNA or RNA helicase/uncharacterized protein (UPF0332 family)
VSQKTGQTWRLSPVRHEEPRCESYDDEAAVRAFERAMRVHRAHVEAMTLARASGGVDGAYRVEGSSGRPHLVDIVDASGTRDSCTCPDLLTNELGTCKHVEAVRRLIREDRRLRAQFAQLGQTPQLPTLTVDATGADPVLAVAGPRATRFARALGLAVQAGGRVLVAPGSTSLREVADGRVVHAAAPALDLIQRRQALAERRAELLRAAHERRLHVDVLSKPLFPYQQAGVLHLAAGGRALLADDMGLGKTVQAIAACEVLRARGEMRRALIVTPASLKSQWAREIERYTGSRALIVGGSVGQRQSAFASDAPYIIINYELTWRDLSQLSNLQPDVLVLDEAQRAKNFRTKTAATLRSIPSRFLFVLTGTPVENRLDDLYSLLQLIDSRALGPLWKFNHQFHQQNERGKVVGYKRLGELRARIGSLVLRRRKDEVLTQLPPLTEQTRYVALSPAQVELEEHFRTEAAKLLATAERRALTPEEQRRLMAMLLKARQACDAAELCDPVGHASQSSPKLDELEQLIGEIVEQGPSKVLVFSEWTGMLRLAARRLEKLGIGYGFLHGGVPVSHRPALLDRFREDSEQRVLLSTDAGGVGLNLQVASYVIHLDLPWNPGRLDQRTARAHRLGQTRGVSVTCLCSERGIERGIEGTLAQKRALRGAALDAASEVEAMDAPSFSLFMKQLQAVLARTESGDSDDPIAGEEAQRADASAQPSDDAPVGAVAAALAVVNVPPLPSEIAVIPAAAATWDRQDPAAPRSRLRLASIVLEAGFPADAVKAAYDALARAVRALLPSGGLDGHAALVAAIYRELVPAGRIPPSFHAALARLHDLAQLESHGIQVDHGMAAEVVAEAAQWMERLENEPSAASAAAFSAPRRAPPPA